MTASPISPTTEVCCLAMVLQSVVGQRLAKTEALGQGGARVSAVNSYVSHKVSGPHLEAGVWVALGWAAATLR